jgi:hypothetical protein
MTIARHQLAESEYLSGRLARGSCLATPAYGPRPSDRRKSLSPGQGRFLGEGARQRSGRYGGLPNSLGEGPLRSAVMTATWLLADQPPACPKQQSAMGANGQPRSLAEGPGSGHRRRTGNPPVLPKLAVVQAGPRPCRAGPADPAPAPRGRERPRVFATGIDGIGRSRSDAAADDASRRQRRQG